MLELCPLSFATPHGKHAEGRKAFHKLNITCQSWENHVVTTGPRGTVAYTAAESAVGAPAGPVNQVVQGVQVIGGNLTISAGPVHHHEYYITAEARTPALLEHVSNFRDIQIATLGKATAGTGVWIFKWETYILWLDPNGWLRIMWGFGLRKLTKKLFQSLLTIPSSRHWQDDYGVS